MFSNHYSHIDYYLRRIVGCLLLLVSANNLIAQKQEQRYNRFQYHKYKWQVLHTDAFYIYFPKNYDSLCSFIADQTPLAIKMVKHNMATGVLKPPNVIIYPSIDQLYESNIGMFETEQTTLPTFITKGNRMVLFFNGSHDILKEQLYEALIRVIWDNQIKEDISGQAKGTKENIPFWFKEGAIKYFAQKWPIESEDALKRSFEQNDFISWEQSISYQPRLSGQAFCYFLAETYYTQAPLQIFQQMRKKNFQRATRLVTKKPLDSLFAQCLNFYKKRFNIIQSQPDSSVKIVAIPRKKGIIKNVLISPDENFVAYLRSKNNKRTLYSYDLKAKKVKKVTTYDLPPWINDYSPDIYPLLQWDNNRLMATVAIKGKITVKSYNGSGSKLSSEPILGIDGINSLQPVSNNDLVISGYRNGQSDIVSYNISKEKYTPFTNDKYDDGLFTLRGVELYFVSKRPEQDTGKPLQGLYEVPDKIVRPLITDSIPFVKWDKPLFLAHKTLITQTKYGTEKFSFLNAGRIEFETLSDYQPFQYIAGHDQICFFKSDRDSIYIQRYPLNTWAEQNRSTDTTSPWLLDYRRHEAAQAKEDSMLKAIKDENPSFLEGVLVPKNAKELSEKKEDSIKKAEAYDPKKVKPYILQLHSAYFSAKVNNDYYMNRYQPYLNYQGQFKFPEVGGMAQGGFSDLFENHHVNIAFRIPAANEGSMFYFKYENTTKKLDWGLAYYRNVESLKPDPQRNWTDDNGKPYPNLAKVKTHYYELSLHYPITYDLSLGFEQAVRTDRTIFQAVDRSTLNFEDIKSLWSISALSVTLNKLQPTIALLFRGFKAKATVDVFKGFSQNEDAVLGTGVQLSYHQPIYKYITLVTQAQVGYSAGQSKVLYQIAGIDNTLTPRIDSNVHFDQKAPYAFQTLITPLRGYLQNTLYGNQYVLFNADLYFPLFQTLISIETPLQFINLLQPGLFFDAGKARETWNKAFVDKGWLYSYGISIRTTLAGYPLRFDIAWPGGFSNKPLWYISLNIR
jgi:hypothetical protein